MANVTFSAVARTDVGRVREHNEDAFLLLDRASSSRAADGQVIQIDPVRGAALAVCDGLGGQAAGEVASAMAADVLAEHFAVAELDEATAPRIGAIMDAAVISANERIRQSAAEHRDRRGMATTVTAALVLHGRVYVSQVGDSRAYLLRKGTLTRLTRDQSVVGQLIDDGMDPAEAERLAARNIVLQAVGVEESLRVETRHWELRREDVLVLCSDGLTGMVVDDKITEIVETTGADLERVASQLIRAANEAGGRDNITVVLARFEGDGLPEPSRAMGAAASRLAGAPLTTGPVSSGGSSGGASTKSACMPWAALLALAAGVVLALSLWWPTQDGDDSAAVTPVVDAIDAGSAPDIPSSAIGSIAERARPATGRIAMTSTVEGLRARLVAADGTETEARLGASPTELELPAGTYTLVAREPGYVDVKRRVTVRATASAARVDLAPGPLPVAVVFLAAAGLALTLERTLDGAFSAERPVFVGPDGRSTGRELAPGSYRVRWAGGEKTFDVPLGGESLSVDLR